MSKKFINDLVIRTLIALALTALVLYFKCSKLANAEVDVVNGITPVSREFWSVQEVLDILAKIPAEKRAAVLQTMALNLKDSVVNWQKRLGYIPSGAGNIEVTFLFGDADKVSAKNANGEFVHGYFKNQLVAEISYIGDLTPTEKGRLVYRVLVKCMNGLAIPIDQLTRLQNLGNYHEMMTIEPGQGLMDRVGAQKALTLAEQYNLALYRGRNTAPANKINIAEARRLMQKRQRVTVLVYAGQIFDLTDGTR